MRARRNARVSGVSCRSSRSWSSPLSKRVEVARLGSARTQSAVKSRKKSSMFACAKRDDANTIAENPRSRIFTNLPPGSVSVPVRILPASKRHRARLRIFRQHGRVPGFVVGNQPAVHIRLAVFQVGTLQRIVL